MTLWYCTLPENSGISANFYPQLQAYLCNSPSEENAKKVQRFMSVAEVVVCVNYPASAKQYLNLHDGFSINSHCRKFDTQPAFSEVQMLHLQHMKGMVEDLCAELDIPLPPLAIGSAEPPKAP